MALGGEVVDLVGPHGADDGEDAHGVAQIAVVQVEVRVTLQMGDALAVIDGGAADDAVDVVALFQQELSQIAAVLAGNAGDECFFIGYYPFICILRSVLRGFSDLVCYCTALFCAWAVGILQKTSIILTFLVYWVPGGDADGYPAV